jgi:transposase-like protein
VIAGPGSLADAIEQVARVGAQLLLQTAIEAEVTAFRGRDRYARAAATEGTQPGMCNGCAPVTVKTTAGPVTLRGPSCAVPTDEKFASQLFGTGVTKTHALEALVIAGFVPGLSTRDIKATLADALGT